MLVSLPAPGSFSPQLFSPQLFLSSSVLSPQRSPGGRQPSARASRLAPPRAQAGEAGTEGALSPRAHEHAPPCLAHNGPRGGGAKGDGATGGGAKPRARPAPFSTRPSGACGRSAARPPARARPPQRPPLLFLLPLPRGRGEREGARARAVIGCRRRWERV